MPLQRASFYLLIVLVTIAFGAILLPFYSAILWAVVLAMIFFPLHSRLEAKLGSWRNTAAALSVLLCICVAIIPGFLILSSLVQQGSALYRRIDSGEIDLGKMVQELHDALPLLVRGWVDRLDLGGAGLLHERVSSTLMQGGGFFAGHALSLGQNTLEFFVAFGVMLYLMFFMFRDGRSIAATVKDALPLSDAHTARFASKLTSVIHATVRGTVIIALIQGSIGGIAFWILGLEPALLWGVLMSFLSLLPAVGSALIWIPAAIYLALAGFWMKAMVLVAVGALVIGLVDNLLRPRLVGREAKLPDYVILISTIGGISLIGINGFLIGPLVAVLFTAAWQIFEREEEGTSVP
ncbi:AI-2E family transporter [Rhizobium sp. CG5]|uniref:AI-2E family transporter n=1 Tax=Rhizobium sp. CG5 TaxID=2726076 RepID=UPI002033B48C|nr:AI-2E family transporter [Rhizobium sp. CG5]MCM2474457.1 AI-2E family transporter [Rhizobium sp. CG5]